MLLPCFMDINDNNSCQLRDKYLKNTRADIFNEKHRQVYRLQKNLQLSKFLHDNWAVASCYCW